MGRYHFAGSLSGNLLRTPLEALSCLVLAARGAQGMLCYEDNAKIIQAAITIQIADTLAAGDACMAGWLASQFLGNQQPLARLQFSAACASVSCVHSRAYAPSREKVTTLLSAGV